MIRIDFGGWWPVGVAVLAAAAALNFLSRWSPKKKLPPGPRGWPLIGVLPSMSARPHRDFARWAEKYGPIMSLKMGSCLTVVVSSPAMAKEFFQNDAVYASRPERMALSVWGFEKRDLFASPYGSYWRFLRKVCSLELFTSRRINQFQGLRRTEALLLISTLLQNSKANDGKPVEVMESLTHFACNLVTQMVVKQSYFGPKASAHSKETQEFTSALTECSEILGTFNIGDYFPLLRPLDLQGLETRMRKAHKKLDHFCQRVIDDRKEEKQKHHLSEEDQDGCLMDTMLAMTSMKSDDGEDVNLNIMIKGFILDLLGGGTDTTSLSLDWTMSALMKHPEELRRVQEELDAVVGADKMVSESDLPNLPYLQAVVKETWRLYTVAPLCVPRMSREASTVAGFYIPANTMIAFSAYSIGKDPTAWKNPLQFDPSRFMGSSVDVKGSHYELIPFGAGRRICPAVTLATVSVAYTLGILLHALDFKLPPGQKPQDLDMTETGGLTTGRAQPLKVCISLRSPAGPYSHFGDQLNQM